MQARLPTGPPVAHPWLTLLFALAATACVVLFVRAWRAANPSTSGGAHQQRTQGRWTRRMVLYLLGAIALYGVVLAL